MASLERSASAIRRLRASAGSRLTEGLLSSNGRAASIGLATALLTLAFTIWFRVELGYQSEVATPLARGAAELNASLSQSLAALRGWVAYGDRGSVEKRAALWSEAIEPALVRLRELAARADEPEVSAEVADLRNDMRNLKRIQWAIEDVARTPGNEPAAVEYSLRLASLRRSILRSLGSAIEQSSALRGQGRPLGLQTELARFRAAFSAGDLALNELIAEYSEAREAEVDERLTYSREIASRIEVQAAALPSADLRGLLDFTLDEFRAYELQAPAIVTLRRSDGWNVAEQLFAEESKHLVERATAITAALAEAQARATEEDARSLTQASYVVIAMALVMGLVSAGTLLVSFRLRQQVHNVMAKAKKLGQYVIEGRIGKGGMGEVYLAHHAMLRRPTAIKLLRPDSAQNPRALQRFQQEVQLTCQLTHPNTIEIFDYGRTPAGIFYYAMEYLEGFNLQTLVSLVGPVEPARVAHILIQACGSLHEAHEAGLLHRDIKPSNIMLTRQGGVPDSVKLLDFGLVKELKKTEAGDDASNYIAGTPMYLAPESILSADTATPQADLYALGAVAYYLLTATPVFPSESIMEVLARHVEEEPEFPSERLGHALPKDLEYVIMACLAKDPAERPASAKVLAEMLEECDCGTWSVEDAELWWDQYGEAARNASAPDDTSQSAVSAELEVAVEATQSQER